MNDSFFAKFCKDNAAKIKELKDAGEFSENALYALEKIEGSEKNEKGFFGTKG